MIELLNNSLIRRADKIALEYDLIGGGTDTLTFGELNSRSDRLANIFAARGVERGDRICFFLSNRVEIIDIFIACVKSGVIVVPVNILYRERELRHIISDAEPRAVITSADMAEFIPDGTEVWLIDELTHDAESAANAFRPISIDGNDVAAIVYTSGTTGRSKGAVLSHKNFAVNATNLLSCWEISEDDRYLAVLPLFHVHGLANGMIGWLASGCMMRLVERFEIDKAAALFDSFRPTLFFGVPTVYIRLLELDAQTTQRIGENMRLFVCGSAPLAAQTLEDFEGKFGHRILERYGMSETLMNISNPYSGERRAGSVGIPLPSVSTKIVDSANNEVGAGETGELLVRGGNVFSGYWNRDDANAEAFLDGWFRTGDLAQMSADGYVTLCGRRSDLIISGGFNIYPREIEEVLMEQKGVLEAVVVGAADERRGELPIAYIVTDEAFDEKILDESCRKLLASFKVPKAYIPVKSLPRTALGKVQKHLLPKFDL